MAAVFVSNHSPIRPENVHNARPRRTINYTHRVVRTQMRGKRRTLDNIRVDGGVCFGNDVIAEDSPPEDTVVTKVTKLTAVIRKTLSAVTLREAVKNIYPKEN